MKALFIGLGSIGQRHLRNLLQIDNQIEIIAYRERGLTSTLTNQSVMEENINVEEKYNIKSYYDLGQALNDKPELIWITNPSSKHIEVLEKIVDSNIKTSIFIEKPLSHNTDKIDTLIDKLNKKNTVTFVGYQNRFHPCIKKAKELVDHKMIGHVICVNAEVAEKVTEWHKYEDYRQSYASKKELGGGVVLTQIHEIDFINYILSQTPHKVYAVGGQLSQLELDVEDLASMILSYEINGKVIPVHIHQDYIQNPTSRSCKIIGDQGKICFDLVSNHIVAYDGNKEVIFEESYKDFDRNEMFLEEISLFLDCSQNGKKPDLSIEEGVKSLKVAEAVRQSLETGQIINIRGRSGENK